MQAKWAGGHQAESTADARAWIEERKHDPFRDPPLWFVEAGEQRPGARKLVTTDKPTEAGAPQSRKASQFASQGREWGRVDQTGCSGCLGGWS